MYVFVCAVIAFIVGSFVEWFAHKHILHNFGSRRLSKHHFGRHHKTVRKNEGYDADYLPTLPTSWESGFHEMFSLVTVVLIAIPVAFISFTTWAFLCLHAMLYYVLHRKMHLDPAWGKKWFPWHWRHHMGKDQNSNWGVTNPLFDYVFRTVKK